MSEPTDSTVSSLPAVSPGAGGVSFREALTFWFKLGFISFGGPAGQIAIMHTELVDRRHWISERRFLHALNFCMILPGPEAQQLATYIGWLLHGIRGGVIAGVLFVLPSLFILMALSAVYVAFGQIPAVTAVLDGVKPAVVAIVIAAVIRMGRRSIKNEVLLCFAIAAFLGMAVFHVPFPLIVLTAGLLGWLGSRWWPEKFTRAKHGNGKATSEKHAPAVIDDHHQPPPHARPNWLRFMLQLVLGLLLWSAPVTALVALQGWDGTHTRMALFFTTSALVTFGGAYAVLPFVAQQAVGTYGWLRADQMIDGLALGETTPGPLIMVVAFIGFVGGWQATDMGWSGAVLGCLIATYFTFLPSFLFILLGAPFIERMRGELRLTAALSGITAAVVGVILNLAIFFGKTVFFPGLSAEFQSHYWDFNQLAAAIDYFAVLLAAAAFIALIRFKLNLAYVVAGCAAVGLVRYFLQTPLGPAT